MAWGRSRAGGHTFRAMGSWMRDYVPLDATALGKACARKIPAGQETFKETSLPLPYPGGKIIMVIIILVLMMMIIVFLDDLRP